MTFIGLSICTPVPWQLAVLRLEGKRVATGAALGLVVNCIGVMHMSWDSLGLHAVIKPLRSLRLPQTLQTRTWRASVRGDGGGARSLKCNGMCKS